jgi:hypothetical protein
MRPNPMLGWGGEEGAQRPTKSSPQSRHRSGVLRRTSTKHGRDSGERRGRAALGTPIEDFLVVSLL